MKQFSLFALIAAALIVPSAAQASTSDLFIAQIAGLSAQPLDGFRYDWARKCTHRAQPGTLALQSWMVTNVPGVPWGIYNCRTIRTGSTLSLHAEGRALDWHLDARKKPELAVANSLINAFLAPDIAGNPRALARRMGIQEIIFNCRIWSANDPTAGMRPYSVCRRKVSATLAHKDHLHIGMNWRGARGQTTFWRAVGPTVP